MKKVIYLVCILLPLKIFAQDVSTVAGNGMDPMGDGGPATAARLSGPTFIAFDASGNFYFAEAAKNRVRKVTPSGIISTVAGNGSAGFSGDGGPATAARLNGPIGVAVDGHGNLYISDENNARIRKVNATTDTITTIAGTSSRIFHGDGGPATAASMNDPIGLAFDPVGNLFISDNLDLRIRKIDTAGVITTVAGTSFAGFTGDGGAAIAAQLYNPNGLACDHSGNLFICDGDRIRMINSSTHIISTIAGNGIYGYSGDDMAATTTELWSPYAVAVDDGGNVFIADQYNYRIRKIDAAGIIHTVAGTGDLGYSGDGGPALDAEIRASRGVALDSCQNLFITDNGNSTIRKVAFNPACDPALSVVNTHTTSVHIYPNPSTDIVNVDNVETQSTYRLLSVVGTVVAQGNLKIGDNGISLRSLSPGMYMLELVASENKKTVTKIIKQ